MADFAKQLAQAATQRGPAAAGPPVQEPVDPAAAAFEQLQS